MDTQPNDIETMLDDSFFIMNTGHVENDNDTTNNIPINNIITPFYISNTDYFYKKLK